MSQCSCALGSTRVPLSVASWVPRCVHTLLVQRTEGVWHPVPACPARACTVAHWLLLRCCSGHASGVHCPASSWLDRRVPAVFDLCAAGVVWSAARGSAVLRVCYLELRFCSAVCALLCSGCATWSSIFALLFSGCATCSIFAWRSMQNDHY